MVGMMTDSNKVSIEGLRHTHFSQLIDYLIYVENGGWYSGNKKQFDKRHEELKEWLEEIYHDMMNRGGK